MTKKNLEFETIYQSNYSRVFRLCQGYVHGNVSLAKDLTHEVFIKVWEGLASFKNEAAISTWIYRIAVNTCLMHLRHNKKKYTLFKEGAIADIPPESEPSVNQKEGRLKQLYHCIRKLPEVSKTIILLELEGVPQKEIAAITGITHAAVRVRLHRIKDNLTKCVRNGII
ncbi:RNA polymerase sigma factor [Spongiimicrobium salis]|uniref:RNA polymerase sigma factor n=1 Tax=Spongiimicrobium salis TaxID=1667022 RepID=UPI00374CAC63